MFTSFQSIIQQQNSVEISKQKELELKQHEESQRQQQILLQTQKEQEEQQRIAALAKQQEEVELAKRAELLRQERINEAQRIKDEETAFMNSIPKGQEGIKLQLSKLKNTCNAQEYKTAIQSLHTVFSQILSHPEEIKYRKIKRDHAKFMQDIGRHEGGIELFIASGFVLETMDEVQCLFSKEPDIEKEMEKWTDWFDLLKLSLELIQMEL